MNFSVVSKYKLQQIKKIDICCLGIYFKIDGRLEYLNTDVLLYILSFLDIIDLSNLSKTSKNFYGLCQCNYVWGPKIFVKDEDAFEKIMDIIYKNNVQYFPNYFYFKHYFGIIYDIDKKPNEYNYLDLFKNIINLAPDLCGSLKIYANACICIYFKGASIHDKKMKMIFYPETIKRLFG